MRGERDVNRGQILGFFKTNAKTPNPIFMPFLPGLEKKLQNIILDFWEKVCQIPQE